MNKYTINPWWKTHHVSHRDTLRQQVFQCVLNFSLCLWSCQSSFPYPVSEMGGWWARRDLPPSVAMALPSRDEGNKDGKTQLRQNLCSLPSFKEKQQKNESSQKYRSGWKNTTQEGFQATSEKWRSIPVLPPFDILARRRATGNPKSAYGAEWMFSTQVKRGRHCQNFSPDSSFSPNILITFLWI